MKKRNDVYTSGSIGKAMIKTAFGMLTGTLAMSGYNIADTYFVGQLGKIPLAAMGYTFPLVFLISCLFRGVCIGVMTTSAQALGANKRHRAVNLITYGLILVSLFTIILAGVGIAFSDWIIGLFGASGESLELAKEYMNIWYFGLFTAGLSMTGNDLLISVGEAKMASLMMLGGMLINVVLDPLFIFGWGFVPAMGLAGAATATIVAQGLAAVAVLTMLRKRYQLIRFEKVTFEQLAALWRIIIRFAVPASLGMLMMPIGSSIITRITAEFGDVAVAAAAAAGRLEMLAFVFPMALGMSLVPMISQNYGARLYSRIREIRRFSMNFAFVFLMVMAVLYFLLADVLVRQFSPDLEVQRVMADCLRIIAWGFGMIEVHRFGGFCFTGCGRPAAAAWLNFLRIIGLMVPFSLAALYLGSLNGLFFARLTADVLAGAVAFWLSKRLIDSLPVDGEILPNQRSGLWQWTKGYLSRFHWDRDVPDI